MHGRNTNEPTRFPALGSASRPVTIDADGVADAVAQIQWVDEVEPPPVLRLIIGGAQLPEADGAEPIIAGTAAGEAAARVDADRWVNEGGAVDVETSAVLRVVS